jgi:hypothetical protein
MKNLTEGMENKMYVTAQKIDIGGKKVYGK